jgi:hypothetical protein
LKINDANQIAPEPSMDPMLLNCQGDIYDLARDTTEPSMGDVQREIERMVEDGVSASQKPADAVGRDPASFIAHGAKMLSVARSRLVKADALYQARRNQELLRSRERLLQMDSEHGKLIENLSRIIAKLEALRDP